MRASFAAKAVEDIARRASGAAIAIFLNIVQYLFALYKGVSLKVHKPFARRPLKQLELSMPGIIDCCLWNVSRQLPTNS